MHRSRRKTAPSRRHPVLPALIVGLALALPAGATESRGPETFSLCRFELARADGAEVSGLGARWARGISLRHYAGVGAALAPEAPLPVADAETEDLPSTLAPWLGAGTSWSPDRRLSLAVAARWTPARVTLPQADLDPGAFQASAELSLHW